MQLDPRLDRSVRWIFTMWLEIERLPYSLTYSFLADPHFFRPDEPFGASQHLWDGDFFSASLRWRGRFFLRIGLGLPANSHPSLLTCPDFFIVFVQIVYCIPQPSLIQKLRSQSICFFFHLFPNIFSLSLFYLNPNVFSPQIFSSFYLPIPVQILFPQLFSLSFFSVSI